MHAGCKLLAVQTCPLTLFACRLCGHKLQVSPLALGVGLGIPLFFTKLRLEVCGLWFYDLHLVGGSMSLSSFQ